MKVKLDVVGPPSLAIAMIALSRGPRQPDGLAA